MTDMQHKDHVTKHREVLHEEFGIISSTPLDSASFSSYEGLFYFPIDYDYLVVGKFEKSISDTFRMKTSTERLPLYRKYGTIHFTLHGEQHQLTAYQNIDYSKSEEYKNELFVPFKDYTNGIASYGGGRYLDIIIPEGQELEMDFNLSYNPYCAYNDRYSCPIPPEENHLAVEINAGVKKYHEDH